MMNEKNFNEETEFDFDKAFEPVGDEAVNVEEPDASAEAAAENASTENEFDENNTSVTETGDGQEKNSNESESVDMAQVEKTDSENADIANNAVAKAEALAAEFSESIKERTRKAKKEIGDDVDAIKGQRADKKKIGFFSGIRFKITAAFIIPVLLMIVLGVVSYSRSAEALTSSYEATAKTTVDTTADYLDMVIETIRTSSYDIAVSSIAREYYGGAYSDDAYNESKVYTTLKNEIESRKLGNKYIKNVVFTANYGKGVSTAVSYTPDDIYESFKQLDIAKQVDENDFMWVGRHEEADALMETSGYAFSVIRKAYNTYYRQVGYVVVDVDYNKIADTITNVNLGDGAVVALITPDGRELSYKHVEENVEAENADAVEETEKESSKKSSDTADILDNEYITGTAVYDIIKNSEEPSGSEYVDYEGEQYLLIYNKLDSQGFMVATLVPRAYIIADANQIAVITAVTVVITALMVIFIGLVLSTSIGTTIRKIMNGLEKAATGDLTVNIKTRRKDEFMILCNSTNKMIGNIRALLDKADVVSKAVGNASESVADNSGVLLDETKSITSSIAEVEQGIVMQAQDAENCLVRMDDLSKKIEIVTDNTNKIAEIADNTKGIVSNGLGTIEELKDKAKATTQVTAEVISNIQELDAASGSIAKIIGAINDIADQTSLLSLNASIEAARAGDAGRGFAVVADSIRKLAEQSLNSVNEIREIVGKIQKQTVDTVEVAKQAELIVSSQEEALKNTIDVFHDIDNHVSGLADNLSKISEGINDMDVAKRDTLAAIESISAVAEETASSATEVNNAASRQLEAVEKLNNESEGLITHSEDLVEAINKFTI